jgi:hypothetical protein
MAVIKPLGKFFASIASILAGGMKSKDIMKALEYLLPIEPGGFIHYLAGVENDPFRLPVTESHVAWRCPATVLIVNAE